MNKTHIGLHMLCFDVLGADFSGDIRRGGRTQDPDARGHLIGQNVRQGDVLLVTNCVSFHLSDKTRHVVHNCHCYIFSTSQGTWRYVKKSLRERFEMEKRSKVTDRDESIEKKLSGTYHAFFASHAGGHT